MRKQQIFLLPFLRVKKKRKKSRPQSLFQTETVAFVSVTGSQAHVGARGVRSVLTTAPSFVTE
jgi:hypothetical protein